MRHQEKPDSSTKLLFNEWRDSPDHSHLTYYAQCDRSDLGRAELKAMIDLPGRRAFATAVASGQPLFHWLIVDWSFPRTRGSRPSGFLRLPFAQTHSGPTAVFINELNARGLERATNGQIIRRCQRSLVISCFGTENGVSP